MNNLVFLEPDKIDAVPFTTSDVIAECAGVASRSVYLLIEKHMDALKRFGRVSFEMTPFETKGGVQNKKIYHLNEEQSTLLITFLKNTEPVVAFKTELVRQFYAMRTELQKRRIYRDELKPIRREMTDVINEMPGHSIWDFKHFTDLAYKAVTGKNAAQLRKDRNAKKDAVAVDYMAADEIREITKLQQRIAVLLEMGMDYGQIKALVMNRLMVGKVS